MSSGALRPPSVLQLLPGIRRQNPLPSSALRFVSLATRGQVSTTSSEEGEEAGEDEEELPLRPDAPRPPLAASSPPLTAGLSFDKLQVPYRESDLRHQREFGQFVAREALLDEELWTAAWLRAESHWENHPGGRFEQSYKKQFAHQEFAALKRRCSSQRAEICTCIVAVKKQNTKIKQNILKSLVGTLDISIRYLLHGETFPGDRSRRKPLFFNFYRTDGPRYGYIGNLCVAKYARRQGIASNMMYLALDAAKSHGVDEVYVHVHKDNILAQKLYEKIGFQMVKTDIADSDDCNHLLHIKN